MPRRTRRLGRDALDQLIEKAIEVSRGLPIHRLSQVVLGLVVAGSIPLPIDLLAARSRAIAEDKAGSRNTCLHERPIVGPRQQVALRLGIVLNCNAKALRNGPRIVAEA